MSVVGLKTFARDPTTPDTYAGLSTEKAIQLHSCGQQLLQAAAAGDQARCRELCGMLKAGELINYQGREGTSALHIAAQRSPEDPDLASLLLELGADPLSADPHQACPKDFAARAGNWEVHRLLVSQTNLFVPLAQAGMLTRVLGEGTWKHHRTLMLRSCRLFRDTVRTGIARGSFRGYGVDWFSASSRKLFGRVGAEAGAVKCARDIAVDSEGNIFLAEQDTRRVQMFTLEGRLIRSFGTEGTVPHVS